MPRLKLRQRLRSGSGRSAEPEPAFRALLRECLQHDLADVASPKVALISDRNRSKTEAWLRAERPEMRLNRLVSGDGDEPELHAELAALGKLDLILDETENWTRFARAGRVLLYLRPGGVLVLRQPRPAARRRSPETAPLFRLERQAAAELTSAVGAGLVEFERRPRVRPKSESMYLGRAVKRMVVRDGHVKLVNRLQAWPKIREEWSPRLFEARGPDFGRISESSPSQVFESRAQMIYSDSELRTAYPSSLTVPALYLRDYHDAVSSPGGLLYKDDVILPETYRHNQAARLRNRYSTDFTSGFADPTTLSRYAEAPPKAGLRVLRGSYLYLDNEFRGHYGHLTTETISRMWAWPERKAADPALKVILHTNLRRKLPGYELEMYQAAGVSEADIAFTRDPVRVEHLVGVTPMFSNPQYVHPEIVEVWDRIGGALAARAPVADRPPRIFVARKTEKRMCRNDAEVRRFFENLGFTVVFPEDHSIPEQVKLFREAEIIAGYAGSAMFTLMFCSTPKRVVQITSESYRHQNEFLVASARAHQVYVAWCRSDTTSQNSAFTFDFEREGEFVRAAVG